MQAIEWKKQTHHWELQRVTRNDGIETPADTQLYWEPILTQSVNARAAHHTKMVHGCMHYSSFMAMVEL